MTASLVDLKELSQAYTRLSERFKTLWTFHQFLQGIHKAFLPSAPAYQINFQALYDEIRNLTAAMNLQPPAIVVETMARLERELDAAYRALAEADARVAPNLVRRFFEKVRTEDEKLLLSLLRFYFSAPQASHDALDKMDFLITLVGARRSLDDGHFLSRFPQELQKLFGGFLALARRAAVDRTAARVHVAALARLRQGIAECERFEDLTEKRLLEAVRAEKHRLGGSFYDVEVLSAILETNLAAKNKFQQLYEAEERRILGSSRRLLELEQQLSNESFVRADALREEFQRFHQYKEEFERGQRDGLVRHGEVARLAESIDSLLSRLEPGARDAAPPTFDGDDTAGGRLPPVEPEALARADSAVMPAARVRVSRDPLVAEYVARILYSIELLDDGTDSRKAAYGQQLQRLRLEPWEARAARRLLQGEPAPDDATRARDLLYVEAAALRLRIDDEANFLKDRGLDAPEVTPERLAACGETLVRAQETDRRFRQAIEEEAPFGVSEKLNEVNRSRFRLLRSFSGLWLLHNQRVA